MITDIVVAGALLRRQVRVYLDVHNISYREHKGWLDSSFVITTDINQWKKIVSWVEDYSS